MTELLLSSFRAFDWAGTLRRNAAFAGGAGPFDDQREHRKKPRRPSLPFNSPPPPPGDGRGSVAESGRVATFRMRQIRPVSPPTEDWGEIEPER